MKNPFRATLAIAALALAGCASSPPAPTAAAESAVPASFKEAGIATAAPASAGPWWSAFADPVLDDLAERAARGNTDVALAAARLEESRALVQGAQAARAPQVGATAGASRQGGPLVNAAGANGTLLTLGAGASWELDLFGRLKNARDAAALDAQAREALLRQALLVVQADVAQTYLAIRHLDAERAVLRADLAAHRETLRVAEGRLRNGSIPEFEAVRLRAEVAVTAADALALDRRRAALEHALAVLVGDAPSAFVLAETATAAHLPGVPAGIPSEVLQRRPDVAAAERSLAAARARSAEARAAKFPSLMLTASGGQASPSLGDLLQASTRAWGLGALLAAPVFDGGRREAAVKQSDAQADAALAQWRGQVLIAFREVEDQLSALRLLAEQSARQGEAAEASGRAVALAQARQRSGLASQLDVLDAQRSELRNRRAVVQLDAARYQATVGLIRALGGGWGTSSL